MNIDEKWMARALALAQKGFGRVHPNPLVGAVLVRQGKVIGEGFHQQYGMPHAEVNALRRTRGHAKGSTLYVNLEPCAHWGKTPPCVDSLIHHGVRRVVAAMKDPNPLVAGKGFAKLRARGIAVSVGVLESRARALNKPFIVWMEEGRPYVTLKVAASLDGKTSTITGESKWITSAESRAQGHRLRAQVDAIAVGAGTVIHDNPSLTSHGRGRDPVRIIFAGRRKLPSRSRLLTDGGKTWIVRQSQSAAQLRRRLAEMADKGISHLLVEGGQTLQSSFRKAGFVDEVICFVAPLILGQRKRLKDAWRLRGGQDICLRSEVTR